MELDTIVCADALEYLKGLPDKSVDMVACDPPYATTAIEWDKALDWVVIWQELKRVIKRGAACVFTASQPFTTDLINSNRTWFRYEWIWVKSNATGFLDANRKPMKKHENVIVFGERLPDYHPVMSEGLPYKTRADGKIGYVYDKTVTRISANNTGERYPKSVVEFADAQDGKLHPSQKPTALFEYLIRTYTLPDAIVLDFCMGSGTTALAARNTGRHFYGCDSDAGYVAMANLRLQNTDPMRDSILPNGAKQLSLFSGLE